MSPLPALIVAAAAAAATQPADAPPTWLVKPTPEQVWWAYPPAANSRNIAGSAKISCRVQVNGLVSGCTVLSEDPSGWEFGDAALSLTQFFRFKPRIRGGQPVEGTITTTISFKDPPKPEGPAPPPETVAAARKMLDAMRMDAQMKRLFTARMAREFELEEQDAPLSSEERSATAHALDQSWAEYASRRMDYLALAYARHLTREEIRSITAFYESPAGRKLLNAAPVIDADFIAMATDLAEEQKRALDRYFCERQPGSPRCFDPDAS